jgi:hypothetical protein
VKSLWTWTGNFRDKASGDGSYNFLTATPRQFQLPTNAADDARFLRYPSGNPLATLGPDKSPVGVPPVLK